MKYRIVIASPKQHLTQTPVYRSMIANGISDVVNIAFYGENKLSLNEVYNREIERSLTDDTDFLITIHDDVWINCSFDEFIRRTSWFTTMFDVFGLAGAKAIKISKETLPLWHLMGKNHLHGCVAHGDPNRFMYTSFGSLPERVVMTDGVLMGINVKKLNGVRFDESIPSKFHFYDLCFTLDCALAKVKVGIGDIPVIHESPGLSNMSKEFMEGCDYFYDKYQKFIGKVLTV